MDSKTKHLWDFVEGQEATENTPTLPPVFIDGLRKALEEGLTCDEIVSYLIMSVGFHSALRRMGGRDVIEKTLRIVEVMKGDLELAGAPQKRAS